MSTETSSSMLDGRVMAGESARESARRQREKAERLTRAAAAWERGADGEEATAAKLRELATARFTVFHDVRWPGRRYANIDHVVVGPGGIFVIDSKNWSGRIRVDRGVLRQNGRSREVAVAGAAEAAIAVAQLVPIVPIDRVMPVLCFVRDEDLTGWIRDVMICSTGNVVQMLASREAVLEPVVVLEAAMQLDAQFRAAGIATSNPMSPPRSGPYPVLPPRARPPASPPAQRRQPRREARPQVARDSQRAGGASKSKGMGTLVRFALLVALLLVLLARPGWLQDAAGIAGEKLANLFTSGLEQPEPTPPKPEQSPLPADRKAPNN